MESNKTLRALIIGATGATGRELVDLLIASNYYSDVSVIVRREIDRWNISDENVKNKLKIYKCDDLSVLSKDKDELISFFKNEFKYDTVFCCLGSRVNKGETEFRKVDYDFVNYSAQLCEKFDIPHFSLISSEGAKADSWFLYLKVKGQADQECLKKNIRYVSIFRPGIIKDRDNDFRFGEKVACWIPFINKIKSSDLAKALMYNDLNYHLGTKNDGKKIFTHNEIVSLRNSLL